MAWPLACLGMALGKAWACFGECMRYSGCFGLPWASLRLALAWALARLGMDAGKACACFCFGLACPGFARAGLVGWLLLNVACLRAARSARLTLPRLAVAWRGPALIGSRVAGRLGNGGIDTNARPGFSKGFNCGRGALGLQAGLCRRRQKANSGN